MVWVRDELGRGREVAAGGQSQAGDQELGTAVVVQQFLATLPLGGAPWVDWLFVSLVLLLLLCLVPVQIYHELWGLAELRFNWRDKVPPYSLTTSLASAMQHYPDRDLLLAMYHVPQVCAMCRPGWCRSTQQDGIGQDRAGQGSALCACLHSYVFL